MLRFKPTPTASEPCFPTTVPWQQLEFLRNVCEIIKQTDTTDLNPELMLEKLLS